MRLLVFGDLHLKPGGRQFSYDGLTLPEGTDAVVSTGDLVHQVDDRSISTARTFLERVASLGVPVYSVPGNHDPVPCHEELLEDIDGVDLLHDGRVTKPSTPLVGAGVAQFDISTEIRYQEFEALDPTTADDEAFAVEQHAQRLEDAAYDYVTDPTMDIERLESRLDVRSDERSDFRTQVAAFEASHERFSSLLEPAADGAVLVTHAPPYNTSLDRHHSVGQREAGLDGLHVGLLGLKTAMRAHPPAGVLSGHSHLREYDVLSVGECRVHMLGLGFRGVATVDFADGFSFVRHNDD